MLEDQVIRLSLRRDRYSSIDLRSTIEELYFHADCSSREAQSAHAMRSRLAAKIRSVRSRIESFDVNVNDALEREVKIGVERIKQARERERENQRRCAEQLVMRIRK